MENAASHGKCTFQKCCSTSNFVARVTKLSPGGVDCVPLICRFDFTVRFYYYCTRVSTSKFKARFAWFLLRVSLCFFASALIYSQLRVVFFIKKTIALVSHFLTPAVAQLVKVKWNNARIVLFRSTRAIYKAFWSCRQQKRLKGNFKQFHCSVVFLCIVTLNVMCTCVFVYHCICLNELSALNARARVTTFQLFKLQSIVAVFNLRLFHFSPCV